jgi:hypothetical protein
LSVPWGMQANKALYRQAIANVRSQEVAYDQADQNLVVRSGPPSAGSRRRRRVRSSAENTKFAEKAYELTEGPIRRRSCNELPGATISEHS